MRKPLHNESYTRFRQMLVEARKGAGLTQTDLGARLGVTQSFVSKFERGQRRIDFVEFLEIARAIDLDVVAFIRELERPQSGRRKKTSSPT